MTSSSPLSHYETRAVKRRRLQSYLLPGFPISEDLVRLCLSYIDMPSLIVLGSCSKKLQRFVYEENPSNWTDIDFGGISENQTSKITDDELRALLNRCNAKSITRFLSIQGCTNITGYGLDAVRGSCALEEIDLRKSTEHCTSLGPTGLDNRYVLGVLSTMAPISNDESQIVGRYSSPESRGKAQEILAKSIFQQFQTTNLKLLEDTLRQNLLGFPAWFSVARMNPRSFIINSKKKYRTGCGCFIVG